MQVYPQKYLKGCKDKQIKNPLVVEMFSLNLFYVWLLDYSTWLKARHDDYILNSLSAKTVDGIVLGERKKESNVSDMYKYTLQSCQ